ARQPDALAGRPGAQRPVQRIDPVDRQLAEPDDQIAVLEPGARRRAAGLDRLDLDRGGAEIVVVRETAIERAADRPDAEPGAADPAVREQLAEHPRRGLDRDREPEALRARDDRGVDSDHAAGAVAQPAARGAPVQ